jgi:hypothetical protein
MPSLAQEPLPIDVASPAVTSPAVVGDILEDYARRGMFKGFSRQQQGRIKGNFRVLWHRNHVFDWHYDGGKQRLKIACVLPGVPAKSSMYREFKAWLKTRQDDDLPDHRRVDRQKLELKTFNRGGDIALNAHLLDGDVEYGVKKLVGLVNEIYLDFLSSGLYFEWLLETFNLDPDNPY